MDETKLPPDRQEELQPEDLDGGACELGAGSPQTPVIESDFSTLEQDELAALDAAFESGDDDLIAGALAQLYAPNEFFRPGGRWSGSEAPGRRAEYIGHRNGLRTTATKEQRPSNPGSDHDVDQRNAFAVDVSNGTSPTPQMDRAARQIAAAAGRPDYRAGFLVVQYRPHGMRMQLIWRWTGHYNHVHAGFRRS